MSNPKSGVDVYTTVDDEQYEELVQLTDQQVVYVELWEDSLADALSGETPVAEAATTVDIDLYLEDGAYFELYGVQGFTDPESDPLVDAAAIKEQLTDLIRRNARLLDIAVDEEDGLVLVLGDDGQPQFYLVVAGWLIDEWDELPDE